MTSRPILYLAGKIRRYCWRHDLVPHLRGHLWQDGPIHAATFSYAGPFFVGCDHGCSHGPGTHGVLGGTGSCEAPFSPREVIENNLRAISTADLVFAYIDAPDCYGTLMELGWALREGTARVVLVFSPEVEPDDFWFVAGKCDAVYRRVFISRLQTVLDREVERTCVRAA